MKSVSGRGSASWPDSVPGLPANFATPGPKTDAAPTGSAEATRRCLLTSAWPADEVEITAPNAARVHNGLLGGMQNFAADRDLIRRISAAVPGFNLDVFAERDFLARAVHWCLDLGIRQFIDLGCGIPSVAGACEVAQKAAPDSRVLCVDVDPVAIALTQDVLKDNDLASVIEADIRRPSHVLGHPSTRTLLNLDEPVAVLLVSVLHLVPDQDDPWTIIARLCDGLAAGSCLVVSHLTADVWPEAMATLQQIAQHDGLPMTLRSRDAIERLFQGFNLVDPGVLPAPLWQPYVGETDDTGAVESGPRCNVLAGVGRKP
jgi:hypothetical protein